jgi:hypothetical protein
VPLRERKPAWFRGRPSSIRRRLSGWCDTGVTWNLAYADNLPAWAASVYSPARSSRRSAPALSRASTLLVRVNARRPTHPNPPPDLIERSSESLSEELEPGRSVGRLRHGGDATPTKSDVNVLVSTC